MLCLLLPAAGGAQGVALFADGFEACAASDEDADRLTGCEETALLTDPHSRDTDGDGLSDGDEVLGTLAGLDLPALGTHPRRKDLLLEIDWQDDNVEPGLCGFHSHKPDAAALADLAAVFAAAPVPNPDGSSGVNLIVDHGQGGLFTGGNFVEVANATILDGVEEADFQKKYKPLNFAANRQGYFHYSLHTHWYTERLGSTGQAEIGGDDLIVTTGCNTNQGVIRRTLMHELGHNLGLRHGGDTSCNRKPNYVSVMNYRYQINGLDTNCDRIPDGAMDFSRGWRAPLDETALHEAQGICAGVAIDWNGDGVIASGVMRDINKYPNDLDQVAECGGAFTVLADFDDWSAIAFGGLGGASGDEPPEVSDCPVPDAGDG